MFLTKGNLAVVLLVGFVSLSLALPTVVDNALKPVETNSSTAIADEIETTGRAARFLLPADFAVKKKRFTIGTRGEASFFGAWRNCIAEGKGLATIESEAEQSFLESMLQSLSPRTRYWIGATNLGAADFKLTWITTDLPVTTAPDSLSLSRTACITLSSSGSWRKNNCFRHSSDYPYLCEEYY